MIVMASDDAQKTALQHFPLLKWIVGRMHVPSHIDRGDLIQDGWFQLVRCVERFDPEKGANFATYTVMSVRAKLHGISYGYRCVGSVPRYVATIFAKINRDSRRWSPDFVDVKLKELIARRQSADIDDNHANDGDCRWDATSFHTWRRGERSLSEIVANAGDGSRQATLADTIADDEPTSEDEANATKRHALVHRLIAETDLTSREREIIDARFFRDPDETLAEIGVRFGVSRERIRQIEAVALAKLRATAKRLGACEVL